MTYLVGLLQDDTALAVANDGPVDLSIAELLDTDFTGESTIGLVEDVLGGHADLVASSLAGREQVEGGGRDDDLGGGVQAGSIEVVDDGGNAVRSTVPVVERQRSHLLAGQLVAEAVARRSGGADEGLIHLEVTTHEKLARHFEEGFV